MNIEADHAANGAPADAQAEAYIHRLREDLLEIEERLIPTGLHVLDRGFAPGAVADTVRTASELQPPEVLDQIARDLALCDESSSILAVLEGRYLRPAAGGDVLRNPAVLPTGRNLHGLNPALIPNAPALKLAQRTVDALLERARAETGGWPESVGLVLWGTDNLKTDGEAIAQVLLLLGARPLVDDLGRVHDVALTSLEELGRPRIDVVVSASGIFRDLFGHHLSLLDRAFHLAALADEPEERNFVRAHTRAMAHELGVPEEQAAARIFSNATGTYGTNVNFAIENRAWEREEDLADMFVSRKAFAYGSHLEGQQATALFERALASVQVTFQNVDSLEFGLTDIDHYNEYLGGMSRAVQKQRGQAPAVLVGDFVSASGKVRSVQEMIALEIRTKALNPRWYEGMLAHGYEGVREIEAHVSNTFGWSVTCDAVPKWVYDGLAECYVLDESLSQRLEALNPHAAAALANRLLEASGRGYWQPNASTLAALKARAGDLEDALERL